MNTLSVVRLYRQGVLYKKYKHNDMIFKYCSIKKAIIYYQMIAYMVRVKGLEPLRRKTLDPKSSASAIPPHSHELLC